MDPLRSTNGSHRALAGNDPSHHAPLDPASITVFGVGYVGLVTAACLAELGHRVVGVDTDADRIERLQQGEPPFHEPGLPDLLARNLKAGRLRFTTDADDAVAHGRIQFIAVGTPTGEDGSADLRQVLAVATVIGERLAREAIVVDKSTVPVGTGERVRATIRQALARRGLGALPFTVVSNPEFLREGSAVDDCLNPDRIVVGTDDPGALETMFGLYAPLLRRAQQWLPMRLRSAEFTKYACNAMLASRVSLMNEFATLAEELEADIDEIRSGIAGDPRIGAQFLSPGCGFGGSCLPKDLRALQRTALDHGVETPMLAAIEGVNEKQKALLAERVIASFNGSLAGRHVAVWGLAFKPGTDDLREAPSDVVIRRLVDAGATVAAFDPLAMPAAAPRLASLPEVALADSALEAVDGADALVIVTEWPEFRRVDWLDVHDRMRRPQIHDGRNVCDPARMAALGFLYRGIGRAPVEDRSASSAATLSAAKVAASAASSRDPQPFEPITRILGSTSANSERANAGVGVKD